MYYCDLWFAVFEKGKVTQLHYHCHSNEFNAALFPLAADNDEWMHCCNSNLFDEIPILGKINK